MVPALLQDPGRPEAETRPTPVGKELRATLEGKSAAMTRWVQGEGPHIQHQVALTDGAEALQQQVVTHVPEHSLVRDFKHDRQSAWR